MFSTIEEVPAFWSEYRYFKNAWLNSSNKNQRALIYLQLYRYGSKSKNTYKRALQHGRKGWFRWHASSLMSPRCILIENDICRMMNCRKRGYRSRDNNV